MLRPLVLALGFLSRLPTPHLSNVSTQDWGRSVAAFPAVGLVFGLLLWGFAQLLPSHTPALNAGLVLSVWVALSGALHLDGLADSADAWVGGLGDRTRTLAIMKDPRCGPMALVVVVLLLLLKYAALLTLLQQQHTLALLWAPVVGRMALCAGLLYLPYVRAQGLGSAYSEYLPRRSCQLQLLVLASSALILQWPLLACCSAGLVWWWWRVAVLKRLGGTTGDTLGASCELVELALLLGWALS